MNAPYSDLYRLPHTGRARLTTWALNATSDFLPQDVQHAAAEPCVYSLYAIASGTDSARRHAIGYTGLTVATGQRLSESLAKLSTRPGFQQRGVSILSITGLPEPMRDDWLRTLESEVTADQCLRRTQAQTQSRAPASIARLRDCGVTDRTMTGAVRRILAGVRNHEHAIGAGTSPWATRGSASLRDQVAVSALRLADAEGRVGDFSWFLDRLVDIAPDIGQRNIARLSDSIGRDVRNRENDLVLARMRLDADRVLHVTPRAQAAIA